MQTRPDTPEVDLAEASLYGDNPDVLESLSVGPDGLDDEVRELFDLRADALTTGSRLRRILGFGRRSD